MIKALAIAAASLSAALAFAQGGIKWAPNYSAALAEAKKSNKLVMVSFYTTWDEFSPILDKEVFPNAAVAKFAQNVVPVRLDVEGNGASQAKKFKITNFPTILFLDSNEKVAGIIDGLETPDELVKHGNVFLKDAEEWPKAVANAKQNPKDVAAVAAVGKIHADRYEISDALAALKQAEALDKNNSSDSISDLYNAIGDYYQNASKFEEAVKYFQKAANTSKSTDKRAYGYLSIATCYFTEEPPKVAEAIPSLEATLKLPGLKAEDRQLAERMLKMAKGGDGG